MAPHWGPTWGCLAKGSFPCATARAIALVELVGRSEPHGRGLVMEADPAIRSISLGSFGLSLCKSQVDLSLLLFILNLHFYFGLRLGALSPNARGSERTR